MRTNREYVRALVATLVGSLVGAVFLLPVLQSISPNLRASGTVVGKCVGDIIGGNATTATGKADCLSAAVQAGDPYLIDCLLGLSGQSFYGRASCRQYYSRA